MPIIWNDPFAEKDIINQKAKLDAKFKSYQDFFKSPIGEYKGNNIIDGTIAFPGLGKTAAVSLGMTIDQPSKSQAAQDFNEEYVLSSVAEEAELWQELSEKHNTFFNEGWEMNMAIAPIEFWTLGLARPGPDGVYASRGGRSGLKNAKFGDIQYGVWAAQAWDGLMQNIGLQGKWTLGTPSGAGRSWRYLADLMAYDYKRINGLTPTQAQSQLAIDVKGTNVEGVGKFTSIGDQLSKYVDMFSEANKVGGQTIVNAMWKEMQAGRPINFDRDKWMQFITLKPEDDPRYQDLITTHGYGEQQAKDIFYKYVGRPLKAEDKDGEIHYTSLDNPARVYFYAGRRSHWGLGFDRSKFKSVYDPGDEPRLLYSPGRYQASFVAPVGTDAFKNLSGSLDFTYSLGSEIIGGKGTKGIGNLFKNLRRINPLLNAADKTIDLSKGRKIVPTDPKSQADELLDEIGDSLDGGKPGELPDDYQGFIDSQTGLWRGLRTKYRHYRISSKDRRNYTFMGTVPKIFRETKEELVSSPFQMKLYETLVDDAENFQFGEFYAYLRSNPVFRDLHDDIVIRIAQHAKKGNIDGIKKIYGDLIDTGITIGKNNYTFDNKMMPRGAAFFRNKVSREMFKAGRELLDTPNATRFQLARGKALTKLGNKDAAYKSIGANLGAFGRVATQTVIPSALKIAGRAPGMLVRGAGVGINAIYDGVTGQSRVRNSLNKKGFRLFLPEDEDMQIIDGGVEKVKRIINQDFVQEMLDKVQEGLGQTLVTANAIPFEKYLGFSSNFYSNTDPYMRSIMAVVPDMAIKGLNKEIASQQLLSHMTVNGYSAQKIGQRLLALRNTDWRNKKKVNFFLKEQADMDIALVRSKKGDVVAEQVAEEIAQQFGIQGKIDDMTGYFIDRDGNTMPHAGNAFSKTEVHAIPNHKGEDFILDSGSGQLLSEFAENITGFTDHRIIRRALGPVYKKSQTVGNTFVETAKGIAIDSKKWADYHYNWWTVDSDITPKMSGIIATKSLKTDALTRLGDFYTRKVFKPLVLLRFAFLTRVFLEEQMRFVMGNMDGFFNHPMHYIQWVTSGKKQRKMVITAGELSGAELDAVKLMQSYEHFEAIQKSFTLKGLLGRDNKAAAALNFSRINKSAGIDKYTSALSFELLQLRGDPLARLIARHGHASEEVADFAKSAQGQKYFQDLADWGGSQWDRIVHDVDFQQQHIQSIEARIRLKTGGILEKGEYFQHQTAREKYRYNIMSNRSASGSNEDLINFIGSGDLWDIDKGKLVTFIPEDLTKGELTKTNMWRGNQAKLDGLLKRYVQSDDIIGPTGNRGLNLDMGDLKLATEVTDATKYGKKMDEWVNHMFTHLMTKPIGYLNRSTAFKQYRYQYLLANWENIQPAARKRFIEEAKVLNIPTKVQQEMAFLSKSKKVREGAMDYELANNASKSFGLSGTKNLLYDASKRHLISDITRNIFPFPEVWFEVAQTWGKLLADKPYAMRNAHVGIRSGENWMTEGSTERNEGFITANPQNRDEKMFVWPFSGFLSSLVYGKNVEGDAWTETQVASKAYLSGINLLGQGFVPGPNPMVGFLADKVLPIEKWPAEVKDTLFGGFVPEGKFLDGAVPYPPWFKKLAAAMTDQDLGDEPRHQFDEMRGAATIQVYRYGMITGQNLKLYESGDLDIYLDEVDSNWSEDDADFIQKRDEAFLLYSKRKAKYLFGFQALAQFMLPTGFQPTYYVKDIEGNSWNASVLADEYRKLLLDNENDDTAAAEDFINKYGLEHGWLTAPSKVSKGGRKNYGYRAAKFQEENKEILKELKLTSWLVLPENPAEARATSDLIPDKTQLTPDEFRRNVNDTIGYFRYQAYQDQIKNLGLSSTQEVIAKRWFRNELILQLPGFQEDDWGLYETVSSKDMFREMRLKWLSNPVVMNQDTGKGFAKMLVDWEEFEKVSAALSPTKNPEWWLQSTDERAVYMRMLMNQQAQAIMIEHPDFFHVWTSVMLKLFRDDKELLLEMGFND